MHSALDLLHDYHERVGMAGELIALQQIADTYGVDGHFINALNAMGSYGKAGHPIAFDSDLDKVKAWLHEHGFTPEQVAIKRLGVYYIVYTKIPSHHIRWPEWQPNPKTTTAP